MNWEETIMRSKTSFFHKGLAANLFKRCWPVWLGYLFDPALIWAHPEVFALFFVAPFGGAAILYWLAARRG